MSGSSGPSISSVGGSGSDDPCSALRLQRALEAPVPGVADALSVGDIIQVRLQDGPPIVVALLTTDDELAGSIVPTARLIDCLRQGVDFVAEVRSASGGAVRLEVRAAP